MLKIYAVIFIIGLSRANFVFELAFTSKSAIFTTNYLMQKNSIWCWGLELMPSQSRASSNDH